MRTVQRPVENVLRHLRTLGDPAVMICAVKRSIVKIGRAGIFPWRSDNDVQVDISLKQFHCHLSTVHKKMLTLSAIQPFLPFLSFTILLLIQSNHAFFSMTCYRQGSSEYGNTDKALTRFCADKSVNGPACACNPDGVVQCRGSPTSKDQKSRTSPEHTERFIVRWPDQVRCEQDCICQDLKPGGNMMDKLKHSFRQGKDSLLSSIGRETNPDDHEPFISTSEGRTTARSCQATCTHFNDCDRVRADERGCEDALCRATYEKSAGEFFGMGECVSYSAYVLKNGGLNGKRDMVMDELACPCNSSFAAHSCCWEPSGIVQGPGVWAVLPGQ